MYTTLIHQLKKFVGHNGTAAWTQDPTKQFNCFLNLWFSRKWDQMVKNVLTQSLVCLKKEK